MAYGPEILEGWSVGDAPRHLGPAHADVGVYGAAGNTIGFDDALLGRHVLFLGGIGTGKTVGMSALVSSLRSAATPDDVFVFFDTKGDYHEAFFRDGDATIGAGDVDDFAGGVRWNLFDELAHVDGADLVDAVNEIAATLLDGVGDAAGDNNRFWTTMAQDLFAAIVVAIVRTQRAQPEKRFSNADLRAVADKWDVERIRQVIGSQPDLRGTLQYIARDGSNTTNSVMVFLQQAVRQVFSASFARQGDFAVTDFLRRKGGRALFLEYDVARGTTLTPVYRTLLDLALKESLGRRRAAGRVFVVLDEFSLLPRLRHIDAGLNFGRSLGLRFVVGTQNVGQVMQAYDAGLGSSILAGFGSVVAFRLYDQESRSYVRNRFGTNRKLVRYDAALKTRGVGEHLVEGAVVEDWDLTALGVGEAIVGLPDAPPVRFRFAPPVGG